MHALIILFFSIIIVSLANPVELVFPKEHPKKFNSYLWPQKDELLVIPKLQARTSLNSVTQRICGYKLVSNDYADLFRIEITDSVNGFATIRVIDPNSLLNIKEDKLILQIEAFDCDPNPHVSDRANIVVNILEESGSIFSESKYSFAISEFAPAFSVVGHLNVINEGQNGVSGCGYKLIQVGQERLPIEIDINGVLRTNEKIVGRQEINAKVEKIPCRASEKSAAALIEIKVIPQNCQPGWNNLPDYIEYNQPANTPGFLFWSSNPTLSTCYKICEEPRVKLSIEMTDGNGLQTNIDYAHMRYCQHDFEAVQMQMQVCGVNTRSNFFLLPDPRKDLAGQISGEAIGALPTLNGHLKSWDFSSSRNQIWTVSIDSLIGFNSKFPHQTFLKDFSLSFWLKRSIISSEREVVLAFTDKKKHDAVFVIELQGKTLYVNQLKMSVLNKWKIDLPLLEANEWHHYSIVNSAHKANSLKVVIDGELHPTHYSTLATDSFVDEFSTFKLTIGGRDSFGNAKDSLNGELIGFSLLLEETESLTRLSCLAKCGESILLPNAERLIDYDTVVDLESNKIRVSGTNLSLVTSLLSNVAYTREDPLERSRSFENRIARSRKVFIRTDLQCNINEFIKIPMVEIDLIVQPLNPIYPSEKSLWVKDEDKANPDFNANDAYLKFEDVDVKLISEAVDDGYLLFQEANFVFNKHVDPTFGEDFDATRAIDSFLIDECLINPVSRGNFDTEKGERLTYNAEMSRLVYSFDQFGFRIKKKESVAEYLKFLRNIRYHLPNDVLQRSKINSEIRYSITLNVVCSLENGKLLTPSFKKKIIFLNRNLAQFGEQESEASAKTHEFIKPAIKIDMEDVQDFLQDEPLTEEQISSSEKTEFILPKGPIQFVKPDKSSTNIGLIISGSMASGLILLLIGSAIIYRKKGPEIDVNRPINFSPLNKKREFSFKGISKFSNILKKYPSTGITENPVFPIQTIVNDTGLSPINIVPQTQLFELMNRQDARLTDMERNSFNGIYDDTIDGDEEETEEIELDVKKNSTSSSSSTSRPSPRTSSTVPIDLKKEFDASHNTRRI